MMETIIDGTAVHKYLITRPATCKKKRGILVSGLFCANFVFRGSNAVINAGKQGD